MAISPLALVLAKSSGSGGAGAFIPLVLIVAVGYFLLIRPARARQRATLQTRTDVLPGVEVTTTAGLLATVVAVDDDTVTLEVAPGVHSRYVKAAIARVNTAHEEIPAEDAEPAEPTDTTDTAGGGVGGVGDAESAPGDGSTERSDPADGTP